MVWAQHHASRYLPWGTGLTCVCQISTVGTVSSGWILRLGVIGKYGNARSLVRYDQIFLQKVVSSYSHPTNIGKALFSEVG